MNLTCSLNYRPDVETDDSINFICSDNKVHIRLDNFNKPQIISGFERKLTYLLTYLFNYSYLPRIINYNILNENELLQNFVKTSDLQDICTSIILKHGAGNFKGLKVTKNYKKLNCRHFGELKEECFPLVSDDNMLLAGGLNTFLKVFRISLDDYLFNDAYSILIQQVNKKDYNKKFKDKENRKNIDIAIDDMYVKLW